MTRTHKDPLELGNDEPNKESFDAIRETEEIIAAGSTGRSYKSGRDLLGAARE